MTLEDKPQTCGVDFQKASNWEMGKKWQNVVHQELHRFHYVTVRDRVKTTMRTIHYGTILEGLIWTIVLLIGSYLTMTMSISLIEQYQNEPIVTTMKLVRSKSKTLPFPPTLCISMDLISASELWQMNLYDVDLNNYHPQTSKFFKKKDLTAANFTGSPYTDSTPWPIFVTKSIDMLVNYPKVDWPIYKIAYFMLPPIIEGKILGLNVSPAALEARLGEELNYLKNLESNTSHQDYVEWFFDDQLRFVRDKWPNAEPRDRFLATYDYESIEAEIGICEKDSFWPLPWFYIVFNCLSTATRCEFGTYYCPNGVITEEDPELDRDKFQACIAFERHLRQLNITTDEYRQRFGVEVRRLFSFRACEVDPFSGGCSNWLSDQALFLRTTVVSVSEVCFQMNATNFHRIDEYSMRDLYCSEIPPPRIPSQLGNAWEQEIFAPPKSKIALSFDGLERNRFIARSYLDESEWPYESYIRRLRNKRAGGPVTYMLTAQKPPQQATIGIAASYRHLPIVDEENNVSSCSLSFPTKHQCFSRCQVAFIEDQLACTPTSLISLEEGSTGRECSIEVLNNWTLQNFNVDQLAWYYPDENASSVLLENITALTGCIENCRVPCIEWRLDVQLKDSGDFDSNTFFSDYDRFAPDFHMAHLLEIENYALYEENFAVTLVSLAAGMGGILGLWLGIDLLLLTRFIITPVKFLTIFLHSVIFQRVNEIRPEMCC